MASWPDEEGRFLPGQGAYYWGLLAPVELVEKAAINTYLKFLDAARLNSELIPFHPPQLANTGVALENTLTSWRFREAPSFPFTLYSWNQCRY